MTDEKLMKNAQYRKAAPMAFLNSRNTAMEMVKMEGLQAVKFKSIKKGKKGAVVEIPLLGRVKQYTNDLMKDYQEFYATEVASVGAVYDAKKTIEFINKTKNKKELALIWNAMSEDERHDGEIRKLVKELKAKFK